MDKLVVKLHEIISKGIKMEFLKDEIERIKIYSIRLTFILTFLIG